MKVFFEIEGCMHCAVSSLIWYDYSDETVYIVMPEGYKDIEICGVHYDPFSYPSDVKILDFRRFVAKYVEEDE